MNTPTRTQIAAMQALPAAIKRENDAYTHGQLRAGLQVRDGVFNHDRLFTTDGYLVALVFGTTGEGGEANCKRLAACWNACAGVPTETLELAGSWDGVLSAVMAGACIDTPEQGES